MVNEEDILRKDLKNKLDSIGGINQGKEEELLREINEIKDDPYANTYWGQWAGKKKEEQEWELGKGFKSKKEEPKEPEKEREWELGKGWRDKKEEEKEQEWVLEKEEKADVNEKKEETKETKLKEKETKEDTEEAKEKTKGEKEERKETELKEKETGENIRLAKLRESQIKAEGRKSSSSGKTKITLPALTFLFIVALFIHFVDAYIFKFQRGGANAFILITLYVFIAVIATTTIGGSITNFKFLLFALILSAAEYFLPLLVNLTGNFIPSSYAVGILIFAPVWIIYILYFTPSESRSKFIEKFGMYYILIWMLLFIFYYTTSLYGYATANELVKSMDVTQPVQAVWKIFTDSIDNLGCSINAATAGAYTMFPKLNCDRFLVTAEQQNSQGVIAEKGVSTISMDISRPAKTDFVKNQTVEFDDLGIKSVKNTLQGVTLTPSCSIRDNTKIEMKAADTSIPVSQSSEDKLSSSYPKAYLDSYTTSCSSTKPVDAGTYTLQYKMDLSNLKTSASLSFLVMDYDALKFKISSVASTQETDINSIIADAFPNNDLVASINPSGPVSIAPDDFIVMSISLKTANNEKQVVYGIKQGTPMKLIISLTNNNEGKIRKISKIALTDVPLGMDIADSAKKYLVKSGTAWELSQDALNSLVYSEKAKNDAVYVGSFDIVVNDPNLDQFMMNQPSRRTINGEVEYDYGFTGVHDFRVFS